MRRGVTIERSPVVALLGDVPALDAVRLAYGRVVALHAVFVAPQTRPASSLAEQLGCMHEDGPTGLYVRVDAWCGRSCRDRHPSKRRRGACGKYRREWVT